MKNTQLSGRLIQITASQGGDLPTQIELFPVGVFQTDHEEPVKSEVRDALSLIKTSLVAAPGGVLPIDFDHGIDGLGQKNGRAAGWINKLDVQGDRILATVEWTEAGKAAVANKEYRFISPVWSQTASGLVTQILRAGLTNNPALPQLKKVASKEDPGMDPHLQAIAKALGLENETDGDKIVAAATGLVAIQVASAKVVAAAGLTGDLNDEAVTAIETVLATKGGGTGEPDPTKFVPMAAFTDVEKRLASLQTTVEGGEAARVIAAAKSAGKLSPALEDWATKLASKDMPAFLAWEKNAPVIASGGELIASLRPTDDGALTETEKLVCASTGVSEEAFLATKTGKKKEA